MKISARFPLILVLYASLMMPALAANPPSPEKPAAPAATPSNAAPVVSVPLGKAPDNKTGDNNVPAAPATTPAPTPASVPATAAAAPPAQPPISTPVTPAVVTAPEQIKPTKIVITPHRAIYDMSLTSVKNGSNITGVSGRMLFEWGDVCDGWAVQQHLQLHFSYSEGDESDVSSTEVTWESKDGKKYNFNVRRISDGKETEHYVGKASLDAEGAGTANYSIPEGKVVKLPAGSLFPSAHTIMILQKAQTSEKLFSRRVFDGSDDDGADDVSVFINQPVLHWQEVEDNAKLKTSPMLAQTAWPVRMAFFKVGSESGESDYEMNLNLLSNGVARTMQIDYGDFSVTGTLSDIEPLPTPGC